MAGAFGTTGDEALREEMMAAISPFWHGNETWLVVIGASLLGAFPVVYAVFLPAFYIPVLLLLFGLIFRGVAFEYRHGAGARRLWNRGFVVGSAVAAFVQGAAVGAMIRGNPGCKQPICRRLVRLAAAVAGTVRDRSDARLCAARCRLADLEIRGRAARLGVAAHPLACPRRAGGAWRRRRRRLGERARMTGNSYLGRPWGLVFPAIGLLAMYGVFAGVRQGRDAWPFALTVVFFVAAFLSLAVMFWPYMIPYTITVGNAAAPEKTLSFLFWGAGVFVLPVIAIYTAVVYWLFRRKLRKRYG
jgi:cytochrome d ubiquinol oxidase subunit II